MNRFKQFLPFLFPSAAIVLVAILAWRWYQLRQNSVGQISEFAQGVEIEDLTDTNPQNNLTGIDDLETLPLESQSEDAMGEVRYELSDEKVKFSVNAGLPLDEEANYQVWLKEVGGPAIRKAFNLNFSKGGYMGSAAISAETLPFEVVVSKESVDDNLMEDVLLRGVLEAPAEEEMGEIPFEVTK